MQWLDHMNTVLGVAGFLITVVTLIKVQSVHRAQREERALLRRLYGTDSLASHLRSAASFLRQGENDAKALAEELVRLCGQIEGISRVLDSMNPARSRPATDGPAKLVDRGYYTPAFLSSVVNDAQHNVDFIMYRNLQISNVDLLEAMERAANKGVHIRVMAISSVADDAVLEQASMVLPWPQAPAQVLRRQLADSEERIRTVVAGWSERAQRQFEYRGYTVAPNVHFARIDGVVRHGYVGTFSSAQPSQLDERGYIELPRSSEPGATLARHFEELWAHSAESAVIGT